MLAISGTAAFAFAFRPGRHLNCPRPSSSWRSHVIVGNDLYGGTYRLFERVRRRTANLDFSYVDATQPGNFAAAIRPNTRMIWIESPSNPLLKLADLEAVADIARQHNLICVTDNTFATPFVQRPLACGFRTWWTFGYEISQRSFRRDRRRGRVGRRRGTRRTLEFLQNTVGASAARSTVPRAPRRKTLAYYGTALPERTASPNELRVAPRISAVCFIRAWRHPQHALARRQMGFGGMVSVIVSGLGTERVLERCRLFALAESLGVSA